MTALTDIPASSLPWLLGSTGTLLLGIKSILRYRASRIQLSRYISIFALLISGAMALWSVPTLFTLNPATLRNFDVIGEAFFYSSMVAQAAIVWFLLLRTRLSVYYLTIPVSLIGLASGIYAILNADLVFKDNFVTYLDPRPSTLVIAVLMVSLFTPVGIYFLRLAPRQKELKSILNAVVFGLVYLGIGFTTAGFEIVTAQTITRASVPGMTAFFVILLLAAVWPRPTGSKPSVQLPGDSTSPPAPPPAPPPPQQ